jgi:hypothetical protein
MLIQSFTSNSSRILTPKLSQIPFLLPINRFAFPNKKLPNTRKPRQTSNPVKSPALRLFVAVQIEAYRQSIFTFPKSLRSSSAKCVLYAVIVQFATSGTSKFISRSTPQPKSNTANPKTPTPKSQPISFSLPTFYDRTLFRTLLHYRFLISCYYALYYACITK